MLENGAPHVKFDVLYIKNSMVLTAESTFNMLEQYLNPVPVFSCLLSLVLDK